MDPDFTVSGIPFYTIDEPQRALILQYFGQTSGVFEVPADICRADLTTFPSPIRSPDFRRAYASGEIPISGAPISSTVLDVIRKESKPQPAEPEYNVYRHYLVETSGTLYISGPVCPKHHWATSGELNQIYQF